MFTSKLDIILDAFADVANISVVKEEGDYENMLCKDSRSTKSLHTTLIGSLCTFNENGVNVDQVLIGQTGFLQIPSAVDHCRLPAVQVR